jgi:hypothetical protein
MISDIARSSLLAIVVAVPAFTTMASAAPFDGSWNLTVTTQSGDCAPTYQFQLQIIDGAVTHQGPGDVRGRVRPDGSVSVTVRTQDQQASGSGRLSRNSGTGRWSGRSSTARCAGTWRAQRF